MMKKLLVVLFLLSSCTPLSIKRYEDISKENIIFWNDIFNFKNDYFVYIFSYTCQYCLEIEKDIINFYLNCSETLYFVEYCNEIPLTSYPYSVIGVSDVYNLAIKGVPTLFKIAEHCVNDVYFGVNMIHEFLTSES